MDFIDGALCGMMVLSIGWGCYLVVQFWKFRAQLRKYQIPLALGASISVLAVVVTACFDFYTTIVVCVHYNVVQTLFVGIMYSCLAWRSNLYHYVFVSTEYKIHKAADPDFNLDRARVSRFVLNWFNSKWMLAFHVCVITFSGH